MYLIVFFALVGSSAAECPDLWWSLGRYCYHTSPQTLDWGAAKEVKFYLKDIDWPKYVREQYDGLICH